MPRFMFQKQERVDRSKCLRGIDVAVYQARVDWDEIRRAGFHFAYIKTTEGQTSTDKKLRSHAESLARATRDLCDAASCGLYVGFYHFAHPDGDPDDAKIEATNCANAIDIAVKMGGLDRRKLLPTALDVETINGLKARPMVDWQNDWFVHHESRTGQLSAIYTSPAYNGMVGVTARTGFGLQGGRYLWLAHYDRGDMFSAPSYELPMPSVPDHFAGWHFWQPDAWYVRGVTHDDGKTPVLCDRNFFNGTLDDLAELVENSHKDAAFWRDLGMPQTDWNLTDDWQHVVKQALGGNDGA